MKMKILFLILLLPLIAIGQDNLDGIGKFKIGETDLSIVFELETELETKLIQTNKHSDLNLQNPSTPKLYEVVPSTPGLPISPSLCPDLKVIFISRYNMNGIQLESVFLTFYKEVLAKIYLTSSLDLENYLKGKYGEGKLRTEANEKKCTFSLLKSKVILKERSYYKTWQNQDIEATSTYQVSYSDECKRTSLRSLSSFSKEKANIIDDCSNQHRSRVNDK